MNPEQEARLERIVRHHLPLVGAMSLGDGTPLTAFGLDSLGAMRLLSEVEEAFDVCLATQEVPAGLFNDYATLKSTVHDALHASHGCADAQGECA